MAAAPATERGPVVDAPEAGGSRGARFGGAGHDQALFVGPRISERVHFAREVTLGVSTRFLAPSEIEAPLGCIVGTERETGGLPFPRGTVEQGGEMLRTFRATARKLSPQPA